jgi:hypothetical protein
MNSICSWRGANVIKVVIVKTPYSSSSGGGGSLGMRIRGWLHYFLRRPPHSGGGPILLGGLV